MNERLRTVTVVPMSSTRKGYPFRLPVDFRDVRGELLTDHVRSVDRARLVRSLGRLDEQTSGALLKRLAEIFSP
jgi:mRNA interferase MazF